ncbi:MAG: hypothetical protein P1U89_16655 [Verrucomicrobiales bacterium]|nr:hypothetical protein [Verrucomicrobiales bacterium]
MAFHPRKLPNLISRGHLKGVLSVRQNKLTFLEDNNVCVARSGTDPRGWRKPVDANADGTGPWQCFRPSCDHLLRSPAVYAATRQKWLDDLRSLTTDQTSLSQGSLPVSDSRIFERGMLPPKMMRERRLWLIQDDRNPKRRTAALLDAQAEWLDSPSALGYPDLRNRMIRPGTGHSDFRLRSFNFHLRQLNRLRKIGDWAAQFPCDALDFLERHEFSTRRWHLLNLWLRVPGGRELFDESPQFAWLLASSWNIKNQPVQRPYRSLRALITQPRSKILRWLDLPEGKGTLKILKRIPPHQLSPKTAFWIRETLRTPESHSWLLNLEGKIDSQILYLLGKQEAISFPILQEIANEKKSGRFNQHMTVSRTYFHIRKMLINAEREDQLEQLRTIRTVSQLENRHDQLIRDLNTHDRGNDRRIIQRWAEAGNQIAPPIPPSHTMTPLTTHEDIIAEGREMNHCLATFSLEIAAGSYYAYAINFEGERATVGLRPAGKKRWIIDELRGPRNQQTSIDLERHVVQWLLRAQRQNGSIQPEPDDWFDESEFYGNPAPATLTSNDPF